ncbi:hypothetical protein ACFLZ5_10015 [Thermodesulfobacteriota bacterium]
MKRKKFAFIVSLIISILLIGSQSGLLAQNRIKPKSTYQQPDYQVRTTCFSGWVSYVSAYTPTDIEWSPWPGAEIRIVDPQSGRIIGGGRSEMPQDIAVYCVEIKGGPNFNKGVNIEALGAVGGQRMYAEKQGEKVKKPTGGCWPHAAISPNCINVNLKGMPRK